MSLEATALVDRPAPTRSLASHSWRSDRLFFSGMAVAAAITVFIGFSRTYFLKGMFGAPELDVARHLHGAVFTSWILFFIVQTSLIAARRTDLHRRLGIAGSLLAGTMVVLGYIVAIASARRGFTPPGGPPPLVFFSIPFFDLVVFTTLVASALYFRRRPETHKRLMLVATIALLTAAIARFPGLETAGPLGYFAGTDLFIVVSLIYDRLAHGRIHRAFIWGSLLLVLSQPLRLVIGGTDAWLAFAGWLTR
jgi:hypothetical protein